MVDKAAGLLLFAVSILALAVEWGATGPWPVAASVCVTAFLIIVSGSIGTTGRVFIAVGIAMTVTALLALDTGWELFVRGLGTGAFIGGFFIALTWLRSAADKSPAIARCGRFLAAQPPGRRYVALNAGGHLFSLLLSYGAISLLGSLATNSAAQEPDPEIRAIRKRRMLLAIQRGLVAMLCWSPLTFSMAIPISILPGASWSAAVGPCLINALIMTGIGWGLDSAFKPKLRGPRPPRPAATDSWASAVPLLGLLVVLMTAIAGVVIMFDQRAIAAAMLVVPVLSLGWFVVQEHGRREGPATAAALAVGRRVLARVVAYVTFEIPGYRSEAVLLIMAGFIGTMGAGLLAPVFAASGLHLELLPTWVILLSMVWLIPLAGQLGMNPILFVALAMPILPSPEAMGVSATAIMLASTSGWALTGASSPFTATTMLLGHQAGVSARYVGVAWNGIFTLLCGLAMSAWVLIYMNL